MEKSVDAFRTISEVAEDIALPQHVLRFWETRFPQIRPLKRAGGRRYYRPADVVLLKTIRQLLYEEGYTIKGVQKLLKEQGARSLRAGAAAPPVDLAEIDPGPRPSSEADTEIALVERPAAVAAEPQAALPASIRAVLDMPEPPGDVPRFRASDLAVIRDGLTIIDECERILASVRRAQA